MVRIGENVIYVSISGITYAAKVEAIPSAGQRSHGPDDLTVSLSFQDGRGTLVRKERVPHLKWSSSGKVAWRRP